MLENNVHPDRTPHYVAADVSFHCLPMTHLRVSRLKWAKDSFTRGKHMQKMQYGPYFEVFAILASSVTLTISGDEGQKKRKKIILFFLMGYKAVYLKTDKCRKKSRGRLFEA